MTAGTPNIALAALFEETGWSRGQFIRAIARVGAESGIPFGYDESAVPKWVAGSLPRKQVRPLVLEALSRRLGRPVTGYAAGFTNSHEPSGQSPDTVAELVDLGSADMDPSRRSVLGAGLFSAAAVIPGWPDVRDRLERVQEEPHTRIGQHEVAAVISMTEYISDLDDKFGGRMARPMAAAFLVNTIVPALRATAGDEVKNALRSAAADHLYLTGYMAMDEREDGLAQRYYTKALELAGTAGDHLTYCTTLRGMSVQAVDLGHGPLAVRLADAAASASPQAGPRMLAFLTGQQAHAAAQTGDRTGALLRMKEAETAMDKAESKAKAFGSYDPSALNYHIGQVRYELGDIAGSIKSMELADRLREPVYRRTRVRYNAMIAERKLAVGRLEEACVDWNRVLDDYPLVQSGRCDDRVRIMLSSLRPHLGNAHAREAYERGRTLFRTG
ncbi:tetratricopeptide repeat protein [Streptomyces sp. NBC_00249]|uniref:tetratricopeptide repeat protein n=1 Tax=Streptomyces sp. NBC_00249 TaxID=2975690 RepID=UPI00224E259A|nr:tetratricopeptide repeat protein [Streptomyces sp. NBC_00249]MCX5194819.1 tetratricopeptide repeat protein [Streptomyces sp. NBC_00249]